MATVTATVLALSAGAETKAESGTTGPAAFAKMKSLAGEWTGTIDERGKGDPITVIYKTTANGTAVMETLFPGAPYEMVTVYHLDGDKLVLTEATSRKWR